MTVKSVVISDIGDIPETIGLCRSLQVVDVSSNPLQRYVRCPSLFTVTFVAFAQLCVPLCHLPVCVHYSYQLICIQKQYMYIYTVSQKNVPRLTGFNTRPVVHQSWSGRKLAGADTVHALFTSVDGRNGRIQDNKPTAVTRYPSLSSKNT